MKNHYRGGGLPKKRGRGLGKKEGGGVVFLKGVDTLMYTMINTNHMY